MKTLIDPGKILCKPFWKKLDSYESQKIQKFSLQTGLTGSRLKAVFDKLKIWTNISALKIGFIKWFDESENIIEPEIWRIAWTAWVVKTYLQPYVGIELIFNMDTATGSNEDVRITFDPNGGSYSLLGTDCLDRKTGIYGESTNIGWIDAPAGFKFTYNDVEYEIPRDAANLTGGGGLMGGTIIHEFGHVLGMIHEHQNPFGIPFHWNRQKLLEVFSGAPNFWDQETIINNFYIDVSDSGIYNGSSFDPKSVMKYGFGNATTVLDRNSYKSLDEYIKAVDYLEIVNTGLSITDKYWLQKNYPGGSAPIIDKPEDITDYDQPVSLFDKIKFFLKNMDNETKKKIIMTMAAILVLLFLYDFYNYISKKPKNK